MNLNMPNNYYIYFLFLWFHFKVKITCIFSKYNTLQQKLEEYSSP